MTKLLTRVVIVGMVFVPLIARTVRAAVLFESTQDYVAAAQLRRLRHPAAVTRMGLGDFRKLRPDHRRRLVGIVLFNALAIASLVLAANFIGDGIHDTFEA